MEMRGTLPLGRLFGIPFRIHYSWFVIFILLTFSLAQLLPPRSLQLTTVQAWVLGIVTSLLFFASVLAHELAHSLVARAHGIPVRGITLFILGGVSQLGREATRARSELLMAFVGPLSSLVLGGILLGGVAPVARGPAPLVAVVAGWLGSINLILGIFNLIPGFPLDGGRVLRSLVWMVTGDMFRATMVAGWIGRGVGFLFIFYGIFLFFQGGLLNLNGIWLAFIGWFLENAASTSMRQLQTHSALRGVTAGSLMSRDFVTAPGNLTIEQLVRGYLLPFNPSAVLVHQFDSLVGVFTHRHLHRIPRANWDTQTLAQVMTPLAETKRVDPFTPASELIADLEEGEGLVLVMEGTQTAGVIDWDSLSRFVRVRTALHPSGRP
ncbi:MAG: site-2 protease family protein [Chloroflexi bacterium]|nr:site-2 protease family protein [Chloroflexota bacterium]